MNETLFSIARSWYTKDSAVNSTADLLEWIRSRNETAVVNIRKTNLEDCAPWFYDRENGCIRNEQSSFFTITGLEQFADNGVGRSQPIIFQQEIGYLGILCREIDGVMHFLMQAKIEPGNINKIQLSPTIQATKSNFTQRHGGKRPAYLDYFLNAEKYEIVVDQIQSEQSSRFFKKRNRNIIIRVEEDVEVLPTHRWMTLGQIKRFMRENNLVNMDTRTVLSCIPFSQARLSPSAAEELCLHFTDKALFQSVFVGEDKNAIPTIYRYLNDQRMFIESTCRIVPLHLLLDWKMQDGELVCSQSYPFKVVFCDIAIDGREVQHWSQPLFEAVGSATFGLMCCEEKGLLKFLVRATPEVGCFDVLELGPTVQMEASSVDAKHDAVSDLFYSKLERNEGVLFDHLLSEEGGRFYHEQNRNVLIQVCREDLPALPEGYFLVDYWTLNELVQVNNVLNIQLRNLLSLLEA